MHFLTKVILFTDTDGYARFREEHIALTEGNEQSRLSPWLPATGLQDRKSVV